MVGGVTTEDDWRGCAGPWARATLPDGQELDVIVTSRERTVDGAWWYGCEVVLPDRWQGSDGETRPVAVPTPVLVHADHLTPLPGESYAAVPTTGEVAGRQWLLVRVRVPAVTGPEWRLHRRDCWQAAGEPTRLTETEARDTLLEERAEVCEVCRPDRALR